MFFLEFLHFWPCLSEMLLDFDGKFFNFYLVIKFFCLFGCTLFAMTFFWNLLKTLENWLSLSLWEFLENPYSVESFFHLDWAKSLKKLTNYPYFLLRCEGYLAIFKEWLKYSWDLFIFFTLLLSYKLCAVSQLTWTRYPKFHKIIKFTLTLDSNL